MKPMWKIYLVVLFALATQNGFAQQPYIVILGIAQDGSFPQAGCNKACCKEVWQHPEKRKFVSSIALINPETKQSWIFDATPDFGEQLQLLRTHLKDSTHLPSGIFLTHAHIGHYGGLMQLGREVMGVNKMKVYAMPRMRQFLENNGPWNQLVQLKQIELLPLFADSGVGILEKVHITPFKVPHRDEYSETVGFSIRTAAFETIFIPDIDKWEKWFPEQTLHKLDSVLAKAKYILVDGTFYNEKELGKNRMKDIPHPFMEESMALFSGWEKEKRNRLYFIHFNHTNPSLHNNSIRETILRNGFHVAEQNEILR